MAFRNAIKLLISKFGLVWVLLLYIVMVGVVVFGLSITFILSVRNDFIAAGIGNMVTQLFSLFINGAAFSEIGLQFSNIIEAVKTLFLSSPQTIINTTLIAVIVILVFRFIFGWYELPLICVIESNMSSGARISFTGCMIGNLGKSVKFVLVKMIFTVLYDALIFFIVYQLLGLFKISVMIMFAPFIIMLFILTTTAFRYSLISMWAPRVGVEKGKIFASFGYSVKMCFKNFGSVYSSFLVLWTLLIAFNFIVGLFTFGAGLLLSIPISLLLLNNMNMTIYYGKNGKRYYVDGAIFTPRNAVPPVDKVE